MDTEGSFTPRPIPTEAELASFDHRDVPGPIEIIGDVKIAAEPTLAGLPPAMREEVAAKMANVKSDHAIFERQFIREALEANSYRLKVLGGPGKGANAYVREAFEIERERYDLESEALRIEEELNDTVGHSTKYDEEGNPVPVPIYRFAPETRAGRRDALQAVRYKLTQLDRERPTRLAAAAVRVREQVAAQNEEGAILAEAKAQADAANRKARVDKLAETFASNRRHHIAGLPGA